MSRTRTFCRPLPKAELDKLAKPLRDHDDDELRVVHIPGVDFNTCCGTHCHNTSQMQLIKLTGVKSGSKNTTLLHFVAGQRALQALEQASNTQARLTSILAAGPEQHIEMVEKLQASQKQLMREKKQFLKVRGSANEFELKQESLCCSFFVSVSSLTTTQDLAELQGGALLRQVESDDACKFLELHTTGYGVQHLSAVAAVVSGAGAEHSANTKLLFMSDRDSLQVGDFG